MKALSLKQPWAHWVRRGLKTIETRTWKTKYRGDLLICASKKIDRAAVNLDEIPYELLVGMAVAVTGVVDCRPMTREDEHAAMCPWVKGKFAWVLEGTRPIRPFRVKGALGIFNVAPVDPIEFLA